MADVVGAILVVGLAMLVVWQLVNGGDEDG